MKSRVRAQVEHQQLVRNLMPMTGSGNSAPKRSSEICGSTSRTTEWPHRARHDLRARTRATAELRLAIPDVTAGAEDRAMWY